MMNTIIITTIIISTDTLKQELCWYRFGFRNLQLLKKIIILPISHYF